MKTAILKSLLVILSLIAGKLTYAQTYDVYVANRSLDSANVLTFDVYIKSNGSTGNWALKTYQCGYKFAQAFVNGGTLSGSYIAGSSEITAGTFGKTWGFSWNATNRVLNQSANTGSACPGGLVSTTPVKIGRFKVRNTVSFGCANDSLTMMTSGSGFLLFAVSKYNTTDCSDAGATVISANGSTSVQGAGTGLAATVSAPAALSCGNNVNVTVTASGGLAPYTGTGTFSKGAGTYTFTVTDSRNCSSTVSVTIAQGTSATSSTTSISSCDSYNWNGTTYSSSGTYTTTLTNAAGCDSFAIVNLTITPTTYDVSTISNCDSYTWSATGTTYTQSGTYFGTAVNCVVPKLVLTINASSTHTTSASACDSYVWANTGSTYTQSGNYVGTTTNCVTEVLSLTITASTSSDQTESACDSYTWTVNGQTYSASGAYSYVSGCDTKNLFLTITQSTSNTSQASACDSYDWTVDGNTYTASGTYSYVSGCHTEILNLTINTSSTHVTTESSCYPYTWANTGNTYTQSGSYTGSTSNCVTEVLNLTITPISYNTTTWSACDSYTWANTGVSYTQSGSYTGSTTNCVAEVLDLTITSSSSNTTTISTCGSYTWADNGQTYTQSGVYTGSVSNCVTELLNLTITPNSTNTTQATACGSYTWSHDGQVYTQSGVYTGSTTNCVTELLNLTITPNSTNTTTVSACGSYTWANDGQTYTQSGTYTGTTSNCVTQVLVLTVNPAFSVDAAISGPTNSCPFTGTGAFITDATYSITAVSASTFTWVVPTGATLVSGQGTNTLKVRFTTTFTSGNITVTVATACGNPSVTRSITVTKGAAPATPTAINGETNVCPYIGTGSTTYTVTPVAGAAGYRWTLPVNVTRVSANADSSSLTVSFAAAFVTNTSKVISVSAVNGCGTSTAKTLTLTTVVPAAPASISGVTNVCPFIGTGSTTYTAAAVTGATGYSWTLPVNVTRVSATADSSSITVSFSAGFVTNTSKVITVFAKNGCGKSATGASLTLTTAVPAAPTTISGPVSVCDYLGTGLQATYTVGAVTGATGYRWTLPTNVTRVSATADSSSITVTFAAAFLTNASKVISVRSANGCGTSATAFSLTLTTPAPAAPTGITGVTNVCPFIGTGTTTYSVTTPVAGATGYSWTLPVNVTRVSATADSSSITVSFSAAFLTNASKVITVFTKSPCGKSATGASLTLTTAVPAAPTGTISGPVSVCNFLGNGVQATYTAPAVTGATGYNWTLPVNVTRVSATADSSSITVTFASAFLTNASKVITVFSRNGCGKSATGLSLTLTTVVPAAPVGTISGPVNVCNYLGNAVEATYTSPAVAGASGYSWTLPVNVTRVSATADSSSITVTFAAAFLTNASKVISVAAKNGCGKGTALSLTLTTTVPAAPVGTISGPANVCNYLGNGVQATYTAPAVTGATGYSWTLPVNVTRVSATADSSSITVTFASAFLTNASKVISVAAKNGCGKGTALSLTLTTTVPGAPVGTISGPVSVCDYLGNGVQATYTAPAVTGATGYSWTLPTNVTRVSATADSSSITVTFASAFLTNTSKVITVFAKNGCGKGTTGLSLTLTTVVPGTPGAISGPANVCLIMNATKDTTYRIRQVAGATSYAWTVSAGITILSSPANDTAILVRIGSTVSGTITVKGVNGCGSSATAASITLSRTNPTAPGTITATTLSTVCPNQRRSYALSAMPLNAVRVQWTVPAGAIIDSITNNSLKVWVTYPAKGSAYNDTVRVVSVNGCATSAQVKLAQSVTACAAAIAGNTIKTNTTTASTDTRSNANLEVKVYPNPTVNSFRLQALSSDQSKMEVRIMDVQGRKFSQAWMMPGETLTLGSELKPGAYMVEVLQGNKSKVVRVIKL